MYNFSIGVIVDSFKLPTKEAILKAASIKAEGLQMYCTNGVNSPDNLVGGARRELLNFAKDNGLKFSAICGDLGEGFWREERNPYLIERSKRILDLALDMETNVVTTHIGIVPEDKNCDRYKIMQEACFELSQYADKLGAHFAIETGPETAKTLRGFLDSLNSKGVAVNLDPANFVMVTGQDPVEAVEILAPYIVHTHAKDGVKLCENFKAEEVYEAKYGDSIERPKLFEEVPLGKGSVDFAAYLKALDSIGYKGFLTIERECGADPAADISLAADFLRDHIAKGKQA